MHWDQSCSHSSSSASPGPAYCVVPPSRAVNPLYSVVSLLVLIKFTVGASPGVYFTQKKRVVLAP